MKCIKCGGIIECDDVFDQFTCDDRHIDYCCGHCVNCDTDYQWKEVYEFTGQEDLEEVSSN